jgi:hypothetical protein
MAVLLSNGTAQRLLTLLGDPRPDPARSDRQRSAYTRAAEPGVAYDPPWTVRWSTAADSYIVHIPSGSAGIGTGTINHTAVTDMADWYTFTGDAGVVYAWWASGKINVGMTPPTDAGTIIAVIAEAESGAVTITQIARSVLDLIVSLAEILTPSHVLGKKTVSGVVTYGWTPTCSHADEHPESES